MSQANKSRKKPAKVTKPKLIKTDRQNIYKYLVPVLAITFLLFLPSLRNGFTNWDDLVYVTNNTLLHKLDMEGLKAIFTTPVVSNYHPITILSLAINYQFAELNPWSYHFTSILLHVINTGLVFWFLMLLSGKNLWVSFFGSLLFGIHPMHVESVAWISERKDLLYTLFYLLALIFYVKYIQNKQLKLLTAVTLLGVLSILSKPAAIVLPLSLLLLDYFYRRPWSWAWIVEKIPLFIFSAIMAYVTFTVQAEKAIASVEYHSFIERIGFAGFGLMWYLVKFIYPYPLSALHPFPDQLSIIYYVATVASIAGSLYLIFKVKSRNYQFGFGFYIINLLLVLQLVSIGNAVVAERYTYVPYIGLVYLLCSEVGNAIRIKWPKYTRVILIAGCLWIAGLAAVTWFRIPAWKDSETLWNDILEKYPESPRAWTNKGLIYYDTKEWTKVIEHLSNALKSDPQYANALEWRARAHLEIGRGNEALGDAQAFYKLYPEKADALFLLARSYELTGHPQEALELYNKLIPKAPDVAEYLNNRGVIYFNHLKQYQEAKEDFERCIEINPNNGMYYLNLSRCYYMMGDMLNANTNARKASALGTEIDPVYAGAIGLIN